MAGRGREGAAGAAFGVAFDDGAAAAAGGVAVGADAAAGAAGEGVAAGVLSVLDVSCFFFLDFFLFLPVVDFLGSAACSSASTVTCLACACGCCFGFAFSLRSHA